MSLHFHNFLWIPNLHAYHNTTYTHADNIYVVKGNIFVILTFLALASSQVIATSDRLLTAPVHGFWTKIYIPNSDDTNIRSCQKVIWIWLSGQPTPINHKIVYWKTNCFLPCSPAAAMERQTALYYKSTIPLCIYYFGLLEAYHVQFMIYLQITQVLVQYTFMPLLWTSYKSEFLYMIDDRMYFWNQNLLLRRKSVHYLHTYVRYTF